MRVFTNRYALHQTKLSWEGRYSLLAFRFP